MRPLPAVATQTSGCFLDQLEKICEGLGNVRTLWDGVQSVSNEGPTQAATKIHSTGFCVEVFFHEAFL